MTRRFTVSLSTAVICVAALVAPAAGQVRAPRPVAQIAAVPHAALRGLVLDEQGKPLEGAVASALGSMTTYAVSDADGRFVFKSLPYGPYLLRVHLQGYAPAPSRLIQVNRDAVPVASIVLARRADDEEPVPVLTAGVGPAEGTAGPAGDGETHDHGEVAWRLRHLKRSVLKDAAMGVVDVAGASGSFLDDSLDSLGRAVGSPARLATSLLADVPWNGHFDLLTSTSFDRPQDLFSLETMPRGMAYLALEAPTRGRPVGDPWRHDAGRLVVVDRRRVLPPGSRSASIRSGVVVRHAELPWRQCQRARGGRRRRPQRRSPLRL